MHEHTSNGSAAVAGVGFKHFAPGTETVHVPTTSRRAALAGLSLLTACRPEVVRAQKRAWRITSLLGPRALRGKPRPWAPPMRDDVWAFLLGTWRREAGDFDSLAASEREAEEGIFRILLLREGEPVALAKAYAPGHADPLREALALRLLAGSRPRAFRVPRILGQGEGGGWVYLLTRPLPPRIHRFPPAPALTRIVSDIHVGLSSLPRPADVPHHWYPMHGELAPWTLRELADGELVLVDWSRATWAPPRADEVFYRAAHHAVTGEPPGPVNIREAVAYWRRIFRAGLAPGSLEGDVGIRMLRALDAMSSEGHAGSGMI